MALAACGTQNGVNGQTRTCALTLTGDVTGSYDCRPATTFYSASTDTSGFAFSVLPSSTVPGITVALGFPGRPAKQQYQSTDAGARGGLQLSTSSGATWSATIGNGSPRGSYVIVFTALDAPTDIPGGTAYTATGSLDATLPAASGAGTVGVHVVF